MYRNKRSDMSRKISLATSSLIENGINLEPVFDEFKAQFEDGKPLFKTMLEISRKSGDDAVGDFIDEQMLVFLEARAPAGAVIRQNNVKRAMGGSREELAADYLKKRETGRSMESALADYSKAREEALKRGRSGSFRFGSV